MIKKNQEAYKKTYKKTKKQKNFFTFLIFHITQSNKAFAQMRLNPIDYDEQLIYYKKDFCNNHQTS